MPAENTLDKNKVNRNFVQEMLKDLTMTDEALQRSREVVDAVEDEGLLREIAYGAFFGDLQSGEEKKASLIYRTRALRNMKSVTPPDCFIKTTSDLLKNFGQSRLSAEEEKAFNESAVNAGEAFDRLPKKYLLQGIILIDKVHESMTKGKERDLVATWAASAYGRMEFQEKKVCEKKMVGILSKMPRGTQRELMTANMVVAQGVFGGSEPPKRFDAFKKKYDAQPDLDEGSSLPLQLMLAWCRLPREDASSRYDLLNAPSADGTSTLDRLLHGPEGKAIAAAMPIAVSRISGKSLDGKVLGLYEACKNNHSALDGPLGDAATATRAYLRMQWSMDDAARRIVPHDDSWAESLKGMPRGIILSRAAFTTAMTIERTKENVSSEGYDVLENAYASMPEESKTRMALSLGNILHGNSDLITAERFGLLEERRAEAVKQHQSHKGQHVFLFMENHANILSRIGSNESVFSNGYDKLMKDVCSLPALGYDKIKYAGKMASILLIPGVNVTDKRISSIVKICEERRDHFDFASQEGFTPYELLIVRSAQALSKANPKESNVDKHFSSLEALRPAMSGSSGLFMSCCSAKTLFNMDQKSFSKHYEPFHDATMKHSPAEKYFYDAWSQLLNVAKKKNALKTNDRFYKDFEKMLRRVSDDNPAYPPMGIQLARAFSSRSKENVTIEDFEYLQKVRQSFRTTRHFYEMTDAMIDAMSLLPAEKIDRRSHYGMLVNSYKNARSRLDLPEKKWGAAVHPLLKQKLDAGGFDPEKKLIVSVSADVEGYTFSQENITFQAEKTDVQLYDACKYLMPDRDARRAAAVKLSRISWKMEKCAESSLEKANESETYDREDTSLIRVRPRSPVR